MHRSVKALFLIASLAGTGMGTAAYAQEDSVREGRTERTAPTIDESRSPFESYLNVTPRVGALGFQQADGSYDNRGLAGLTFNLNPGYAISRGLNLGIESGILFSHLGSPSADFVGSSPSGSPGANANAFLVPGHLSVGYALGDRLLAAVNFGTTMLYQSQEGSVQIGRRGDGGKSFDFFPSAGLNLGYALGRSFGISLRGDYIPTPAKDLYTATLGATIPIA